MIRWIKNNWADPVWSKVFAGIILGFLATVASFIYSSYKQIPVAELYQKSLDNYVHVNYFTIALCILILLALIVSAISMKIIRFQLKNVKLPQRFRTSQFDLQEFLKGKWHLVYTHNTTKHVGQEPVRILNGTQYYIGEQLTLVLTEIEFLQSSKEIHWTKTSYSSSQKHSNESLTIFDNNTIEGTDNLGHTLKYSRVISQ